ncbi:MAG: O-antigen ligase family protein [Bacillota bacterium]|nr:O-antigen ligase family protein [Bacillota bacterium]
MYVLQNPKKYALILLMLLLCVGIGLLSAIDYKLSLILLGLLLFMWIFITKKMLYFFLMILPIDSFLFIDRYSSKYVKFGFIIFLVLIALLYLIKNKSKISTELLIALSTFVIIFVVNTVTSKSPLTSSLENATVILVSCTALISYVLINQQSIEKILKFIIFTSTLVSVWGILQYVSGFHSFFVSDEILQRWSVYGITGGDDLADEYHRITGTFFSPNTLGVYLNTIIILLFSIVLGGKYNETFNKKFVLIAISINSLGLFLTFSRTSWFSLLLAIAVILFLKERKKFLISIFLLLLFFVVSLVIIPNEYWVTKLRLDMGLGLRYYLWLDGWLIFRDYPIFGVGQGMFSNYYLNYVYIPSTYLFEHPHNMLLFMLSELGLFSIIFFTMFSAMYLTKLKELYSTLKNHRSLNSSFIIGLLGVYIVNLGSGLANKGTIIGWSSATILFWFLLGLTYKLGSKNNV